jgi:DNA-directed RNA polymerase specialized sigma24 family protein
MGGSRLIEAVTGARVRDLEEVYRLRYPQFLRVAAAIGGSEDAGHDAVQEGFADVLRHRRTFRGDGTLEAWVWRTVVNAARRERVKRIELAPIDEHEPSVIGDQYDGSAIRPWLASLPERQRLALFLR